MGTTQLTRPMNPTEEADRQREKERAEIIEHHKKIAAKVKAKKTEAQNQEPILLAVRKILKGLNRREKAIYSLAVAMQGADQSGSGNVPTGLNAMGHEFRIKYLEESDQRAGKILTGNAYPERGTTEDNAGIQQIEMLIAMIWKFS